MIKCKSNKNCLNNKCIIDCDSRETLDGEIVCDIAEDLEFSREKILTHCECAEPADIHDAALKELWS